MQRKDAESLFAKAKQVRALVVGDLMLDEYLWGRADRISPEAPVQVVQVTREDLRLGGAGNVVNNLTALGCQVSICSVIGADDNGTILNHVFTGKGVGVEGVFEDPSRTTSKKTRVVAANQQIVRIDRESKEPLSREMEEKIVAFIQKHAANFQVLLVSDYLKGVLTEKVVQTVIAAGRRHGIPILVDPKGADYTKYRGATILTPNRKEAEQASGVAITDEASLHEAADLLLRECALDALLITRSEQGMSLFEPTGSFLHIPTFAREVYDVTGAGDTVLAMMGLGLACDVGVEETARLANVAAGIAVGKLGTSTVSPLEIIGAIGHGHLDTDSKIKNLDALAQVIQMEKSRGKRIVFTNGCFDLIHVGHVKYLQKARSFGDILVLGLNSDASVKRLKGEKRPLIAQDERAHLLAALNCIDYVVFFDDDTPQALIETLQPHVLVKGGDYTPETVVGRDIVESHGGRVELVEFVDGKSTTNIIEKILSTYGE